MRTYTLTFSDGSTTDVLASSEAKAYRMYPNAIRRAIPSESAPKAHQGEGIARVFIAPARGRFVLNPEAVQDAVRELGLNVQVRIRFHARAGNTNGIYRRYFTHHDIMLKTYLTPKEASSTLWHELTHAMQAERAGAPDAWNAYAKAQRSYSYDNRPIEVEARAMSALMADFPLTF